MKLSGMALKNKVFNFVNSHWYRANDRRVSNSLVERIVANGEDERLVARHPGGTVKQDCFSKARRGVPALRLRLCNKGAGCKRSFSILSHAPPTYQPKWIGGYPVLQHSREFLPLGCKQDHPSMRPDIWPLTISEREGLDDVACKRANFFQTSHVGNCPAP